MNTSSRIPFLAIAVAGLIFVLIAVPGIADAQTLESSLEDGGAYWEGTIITEENYAPDSEEASIYDQGGSHVTNISLNNGTLEIDSTEIGVGEFYVIAPDAPRRNFEIVEQEIHIATHQSRRSVGPPFITGDIDVSTNRGTAELAVSGVDDLTITEGDFERINDDTIKIGHTGTVQVSLDALAGQTVSIQAKDSETGVTETKIIDIPTITQPPKNAEDSIEMDHGDFAWVGELLKFDGPQIHQRYYIETVSGERIITKQTAVDGSLYINTSSHDSGIYRILNNSSGEEFARYELKKQKLNVEINTFDTTAEISINSNRENYSTKLQLINESGANLTNQSFDSVSNPFYTFRETDGTETFSVKNLESGRYNLTVRVTDLEVQETESFEIDARNPTTTLQTTNSKTQKEPSTSNTGVPTKTKTIITETEETETQTTRTDVPGFGITEVLIAIFAGWVGIWRQN